MGARPHQFRFGGWLVTLCFALAASTAWSGERTLVRQFEVGPHAHLVVDAELGSITVHGQGGREVTVHADARGSNRFLTGLELTAQQGASGVFVNVRMPPRLRDWFGWDRVRLTIEVPHDCSVQLSTSGGGLDVRDVNAPVRGSTTGGSIFVAEVVGSVEMNTSGGGIRAEQLSGPIDLGTTGGSITVVHAIGDLEAHSSGGDIRLENVDARIRAMTSGGNIRTEGPATHSIYLATSGGNVSLRLPLNAHASIDAWARKGGRVRSELPLSRAEIATSAHIRGDFNGGGDSVVLRTSGGRIKILSDTHAEVPAL